MTNDLITDVGFAMCLLGLIIIICFGLALPLSREKLFNNIIKIGSTISVLGGVIIITRI
jgi:hypothetical protein